MASLLPFMRVCVLIVSIEKARLNPSKSIGKSGRRIQSLNPKGNGFHHFINGARGLLFLTDLFVIGARRNYS